MYELLPSTVGVEAAHNAEACPCIHRALEHVGGASDLWWTGPVPGRVCAPFCFVTASDGEGGVRWRKSDFLVGSQISTASQVQKEPAKPNEGDGADPTAV